MSKQPITVYFSDSNAPDIYRLTFEQIEIFQENNWEGMEKFKVPIEPGDVGYAPDWLVTPGTMVGFDYLLLWKCQCGQVQVYDLVRQLV